MEEIPNDINRLKNLKNLNLYESRLSYLPASISLMEKLEYLEIRKSQISVVNICNIFSKYPKYIKLSCNPKTEDKPEAEKLLIKMNMPKVLPKEIGMLENLEHLSMWEHEFESIPEEIGKLQNLQTLDLGGWYLKSLPKELWKLKKLKNLYLWGNPILNGISPDIGNLQNLRQLDLWHISNEIETIPNEIGSLKKLEFLKLSGNKIKQIPPKVFELNNLKILYLSGNPLERLPSELWKLKKLEFLDLGGTRLDSIPAGISQLINLKTLILNQNRLTKLPSQIYQIKSLKVLEMNKNPISISEIENIRKSMPWCEIQFSLLPANELFDARNYHDAFISAQYEASIDSLNSDAWLTLGFYACFANKPEEAINASQKALQLNPTNRLPETNLALGYLLSNQWEKAAVIYKNWKGKPLLGDGRPAVDLFLQDLNDLEIAGVKHPDIERARKLLKE